MRKTALEISGEQFLINGRPTYSEFGSNNPAAGLLMNARFIQGIFDDGADARRFDRFGRVFDPDKNTDALIAALPQWYASGLRAFTVGFQGGGACFTIPNDTVSNSPYSFDGTSIDPRYLARMRRILDAADELGMVVIVSLFYCGQIRRLDGARAILAAVRTACAFLRDGGWKNVIIEVANEYTIEPYAAAPLIREPQGMAALIELARRESGLYTGSSAGGGIVDREVARASDVVFIHGNGMTRQQMMNCISRARRFAPGRPVLCNEDSQALGNMQAMADAGVSWGYYNNMTKQEPPADWTITPGEDAFFTWRMAKLVGLDPSPLPFDEQFVFQGLRPDETWEGKCWPRLASLYPERIDYVDFYLDGIQLGRCYDEPFTLGFAANWMQLAAEYSTGQWTAKAVLRDGTVVSRSVKVGG